MTMRGHIHHRCRGFSLIETIASITVMAIIGTLCSRLLIEAYQGERAAIQRHGLTEDLSYAMTRMVRMLRDTHRLQSGGPAISQITQHRIQWIDESRIEYVSGRISLIENENQTTLLEDATQLRLRLYNETGSPISLPVTSHNMDDVHRVEIYLEAERHGVTARLRSRTFLRAQIEGLP